jgi:hypothetical protein
MLVCSIVIPVNNEMEKQEILSQNKKIAEIMADYFHQL